jgi:adenylate cyclase
VDPGGDGKGGLTATGLVCVSCGAQSSPSAKFCSECGTPLDKVTQAAEYKQVTVLFADVVRSMDIAAAVGAERLREIMTADDAAVRTIEGALQTAQASGDDYAVGMVKFVLGCDLWHRDAAGDRYRGLELLAQVRDMCMHRRFPLSELPTVDIYAGRERARDGDRDGGLPMIRKSVDDMFTRGQIAYCVSATGFLVEVLLEGSDEVDTTEAEAAIARLRATPAEGSVIRDIWLLRLRALLARTRGEQAAYGELRDRYRAMATSLGFEGHVAVAEAMP